MEVAGKSQPQDMSVMDAGAMNQTGTALLWRGLMLRG